MGYAILKGEGAIRHKIRDLFSSRTRTRRRLIMGPLTDLVPLDHLPDIYNVKLYAWGGHVSLLDQAALAALARRGARINWVSPMHLRLYWVKGQGAVIGPGLGTDTSPTEEERGDQGDDLALFLDNAALMVVDEVLGPLLVDRADHDTFADVQENCTLLWRLAEGLTWARLGKDDTSKVAACRYQEAPPAGKALTALERWREATALESWHQFLAEETWKPDGLLCFYERPRTPRVEHCCRFFLGLSGRLDG
jgi:hypothetical protein